MIKVERQVKVELSQAKFLDTLEANSSSVRFCSAREEGKIVDLGGVKDNMAYRTVIGAKDIITKIFPQSIVDNAANVVSATMTQEEFNPQATPSELEGVIDIGSINRAEVTRTIIGSQKHIQTIFPNIELPV